MKRYVIQLFAVLTFLGVHLTATTDWQTTLEHAFPNGIVETFDNLQDWAAPGNLPGYINSIDHPAAMPKRSNGTASNWNMYYSNVDTTRTPWLPVGSEGNIKHIANFGPEYSLWGGKSAAMSYSNYAGATVHRELDGYDRARMYGLGRLGVYFGTPGNPASGLNEVYLFYRFKFSQMRFSLTASSYTWTQSRHGTEEYYLTVGSPGIFPPNHLTINNSRISNLRVWKNWIRNTPVVNNGNGTVTFDVSFYDPPNYSAGCYLQPGDKVTIAGTSYYDGTHTISSVSDNSYRNPRYISIPHAYYPETPPKTATLSVTLGNLGVDQWAYGDNDNLGYRTIYVRLSGSSASARNPNNKPSGYIQYENDFWSRDPYSEAGGSGHSNGWVYFGYPKMLTVHTGYNNSRDYVAQGWMDQNSDAGLKGYGLNFHIVNMMGNGLGIYDCRFVSIPHVATYNSTTGKYNFDNLRNPQGQYFLPYSGIGNSLMGHFRVMANSTVAPTNLIESSGWFNVEWRFNLGTVNQWDASEEFWMYDDNGNVIAHNDPDPQFHNGAGLFRLKAFLDHKINVIQFGGNKVVDGYGVTRQTSWNNRWYLDDVIINPDRIGPRYFALARGLAPPSPPKNLRPPGN